MRINKFISQHSTLSRRAVDSAIAQQRITVNGQLASVGQHVDEDDIVQIDGKTLTRRNSVSVILNKPRGYVVSRDGQGSKTIYELLPTDLQYLKPVGRLDKDSSGLLLLTTDGQQAYALTHPKFYKTKVYEIVLNKPLQPLQQHMITDIGIQLDDGRSQLQLDKLDDNSKRWRVTMHEGRNRQIRRTFAALGYTVTRLHRTNFGNYQLNGLADGAYKTVDSCSQTTA